MENEANGKCGQESKAGPEASTHDIHAMSVCDVHIMPPVSIHLTDMGPKPGPSVQIASVTKKHLPTNTICSE